MEGTSTPSTRALEVTSLRQGGLQMMDFTGAANLIIENNREAEPTFETVNGRSWIDLTFSRGVTVEGWAVGTDELLSDHKLISFSVHIDEGVSRARERRMVISKADWERFRVTMRDELTGGSRGNTWWTPELGVFKTATRKARIAAQSAREPDRRR